jgi:O-antigen/teichoic acid export membrane protein
MTFSADSRSEVAQIRTASVWRGSAAAFAANVSVVVLGLATSLLVARGLGPTGKGSYDLGIATAGLLTLAIGLSLPGGIAYAVAQRKSSPSTLARLLVALAGAQAAIAALVLLVGTAIASDFFGSLPGLATGALVVIIAANTLVASLRGILVGVESIGRASLLDLLGRLLTFSGIACALVLSLLSRELADYVELLWATALAGVISCLLAWAALRQARRAPAGPPGARVILAFSLPAHLGNLVQFLNYRLDLFLVSAFATVASVGIYALAVSFAQMAWLAPSAIAVALLPRIAAEAGGGVGATDVARVARVSFALSVLAALVLSVGGPPVIAVLYGHEFGEAGGQLLLLLPGITLFGPAIVLASYIAGLGRQKLNMYVSIVALVVTIAFDLLLIPPLAGYGAAIASTLSYATTAVLTFAVASRMGSLTLVDMLIPRREDLGMARIVLETIRGRTRSDRSR